MSRKKSRDETRMVDNTDYSNMSSREISALIKGVIEDTKAGNRANEEHLKELQKHLGAARYREQQAAQPEPVTLTEDQRAWLRECNRERAQRKARVGALRSSIDAKRQELAGYRARRKAIVGDRFTLEERAEVQPDGTRVWKRVKVKIPGKAQPTEWDSKIAQLEEEISRLEGDLASAERALAVALEAEDEARRGVGACAES